LLCTVPVSRRYEFIFMELVKTDKYKTGITTKNLVLFELETVRTESSPPYYPSIYWVG
jgi:hypothetical protein